jgi:tetratricopeptide (TPR) repeat protein
MARNYYYLGVFSYEDGAYEDAEDKFLKALDIDPANPDYNHELGKTYLRMGRYADAEIRLKAALQVDPDIPELKYDLASAQQKTGRRNEADRLFQEIAKEEPSNVLAKYHAGISLYRQGRCTEAIEYLLEAAEKSSTIRHNGHYYIALCYYSMGKTDEAIAILELLRDHAGAESLRKSAANVLEEIENRERASKHYSIFAKVGYGYDDNVKLAPQDEDIVSDEADFFAMGYVSGSYNFFDGKSFKIGAGYIHYQTRYNDLEEFDLIGSTGNLYAKYTYSKVTFSLNYLPSFYWLDWNNYLRRHQIRPMLVWKISSTFASALTYNYNLDKYFQDSGRNGHSNNITWDGIYNVRGGRVFLLAGAGFRAKSASSPDQDYDQLTARLGITAHLPWGVLLNLKGKYYKRDYDNVDSFFGVKREDDNYQGSISFWRELYYKWLGLSFTFDYTDNHSNINDFTYDRRITSLSLTAKY